jgi:lactonase
VFDAKGNLYVTDCTGTPANSTGGIYQFSTESDYKTMTPVYLNMAMANGVAIAPEGNIIYVVETGRSSLHRLEVLPDGITIAPIAGAIVAYHTVGAPAADSMKVDSEGNVYVAMNFQGRCLIMNKYGIPLAHLVIPGRDEGRLLQTANLAFKPGTDEAYITASGKGGGWVYKFRGLAQGLKLFSHQ